MTGCICEKEDPEEARHLRLLDAVVYEEKRIERLELEAEEKDMNSLINKYLGNLKTAKEEKTCV